jgi:hypothetical protein
VEASLRSALPTWIAATRRWAHEYFRLSGLRLPLLTEEPSVRGGRSSYEICPGCGTELGYNDFLPDPFERAVRKLELEHRWVDAGVPGTRPARGRQKIGTRLARCR